MPGQHPEPAAIIFPVPPQLKEQYAMWSENLKSSWGNEKLQGEGFMPVFVPVFPAYPGSVPYPAVCPGMSAGNCSCSGAGPYRPPGINPFILFLILVLLLLGTRKDQILAALRKMILSTEKPASKKTK